VGNLILDNDPVIKHGITPNMARCIIGTPFADPLENLVAEGEDEGEDLNLGIFGMEI
jgi:hypothetical protein